MKFWPAVSVCGMAVARMFGLPEIVNAEFAGPYSLTPPAPGVYSASQLTLFTNDWKGGAVSATVNTVDAPSQLELSVPTGSFVGNALRFETRAAADGWVRFDAASVSRGMGHLSWFRQSAGGYHYSSVALDSDADGEWNQFEFPVQTGDVFGFLLFSGSDAIEPYAPPVQTLTISKFFAPLPPPVLTAPRLLPEGAVRLTVTNLIAGKTCVVAVSTNLLNWTPILTNVPAGDSLSFAHTLSAGAPRRFYRAWQIRQARKLAPLAPRSEAGAPPPK